jgi:hypothetical protein
LKYLKSDLKSVKYSKCDLKSDLRGLRRGDLRGNKCLNGENGNKYLKSDLKGLKCGIEILCLNGENIDDTLGFGLQGLRGDLRGDSRDDFHNFRDHFYNFYNAKAGELSSFYSIQINLNSLFHNLKVHMYKHCGSLLYNCSDRFEHVIGPI